MHPEFAREQCTILLINLVLHLDTYAPADQIPHYTQQRAKMYIEHAHDKTQYDDDQNIPVALNALSTALSAPHNASDYRRLVDLCVISILGLHTPSGELARKVYTLRAVLPPYN